MFHRCQNCGAQVPRERKSLQDGEMLSFYQLPIGTWFEYLHNGSLYWPGRLVQRVGEKAIFEPCYQAGEVGEQMKMTSMCIVRTPTAQEIRQAAIAQGATLGPIHKAEGQGVK